MDREIDERTSVDINLHRGMDNPRLFDEFEQWFASNFTMEGTIRTSHYFFQILWANFNGMAKG